MFVSICRTSQEDCIEDGSYLGKKLCSRNRLKQLPTLTSHYPAQLFSSYLVQFTFNSNDNNKGNHLFPYLKLNFIT